MKRMVIPLVLLVMSGFLPVFVNAQSTLFLSVDFLTYLGGSSSDEVRCMIVDGNGDIIIAGQTQSDDFMNAVPNYSALKNENLSAYRPTWPF